MSEKYPGGFVTYNPPTPSQTSATGIWTLSQQQQYQQAGLWPNSPSQVSRSLRFNSADSAFLSRTPTVVSNQKTWTWSGWVKLSAFSADKELFSADSTGGARFTGIRYTGGDALDFVFDDGSGQRIRSSAIYRDPSAWYHVVAAMDTTQATASNRMKLYVNGVQITAFAVESYPSQNADSDVNSTRAHNLGRRAEDSAAYFNGYMANVQFVDGQALDPTSFGEYNVNTGVWQPLQKNLTYGTNGFQLTFNDNTNTTATTLGADSSGNGNNWTPSNFSVTTGANNDSMVDSPTSYGTDTGVGGTVRGNYCTLNPLSPPSSGSPSYTNGNLDGGVATYQSLVSTFSMTSSKWYWEVTPTGNTGSAGYFIAVSDANFPMSTRTWQGANFWGYFSNGSKYTNGGSASYGASFTTNDVIGVALDMDAGTVTFYKNGTSQGVAYSSLTGKSMQATVGDGTSGSIQYFSCNFGQRPFAYTAPSGFKALCTQNLPTPTIGATSATLAGKYFAPVLWTGNGASSRAITGVGFQPDWVWDKMRSAGYQHAIVDSVRGGNQVLHSNSTSAEDTNWQYGYVSSFDSDGFTIQAGSTSAENWNLNAATFVAWCWKANGTGSSNTAGSITSTVSANTTSGFSVVTYTGNSTNGATIGHGLGVAPVFVIVKSRNDTFDWIVWSSSFATSSTTAFLNTTDAAGAYSVWSSTLPSSTVITLPSSSYVNGSTKTYVAYCFAPVAGYSAFGSFIGNASADGPFIYTGFRPAYIMLKRTDTGGYDWYVFDTKRNTYNLTNASLYPDLSAAEGVSSVSVLDILSNGFKMRGSSGGTNPSSGTMIYAAFAENPFKYSLAR
jgi:hypothetical protein